MSKRDKLYKQNRHSKTYKHLKSAIQKETRNLYWSYIEKVITPETESSENTHNQSKKFWTYIKHCRSNNSSISPLKNNGSLHSDPKQKAEILNNQFKSVFTSNSSTPNQTLPIPKFPMLNEITITENGFLKMLINLKPHKASGPDNLSPRVLKELAIAIAPCLTIIFNKSYDTGCVPKDWRHANVAPIFKKGEKYLASNYRPVSLTCIASKLMEHIITSNLMQHSQNNNILYHRQHGFRPKLSCETQLLEFVDEIVSNMNSGTQTDVIVMDFSNAFEKVSHSKLIKKLYSYGVSGKTNKWIQAFLSGRTQSVLVDTSSMSVEWGVPQGSVLGP